MSEPQEIKWVRASEVTSDRDGIGLELVLNNTTILEIFRDDSKKTRSVTLYKDDISLTLLEEAIVKFKKEIPWDFLD
jgi:predicted nucleotidyltransferase